MDYQLLDFGEGRRLERFGSVVLDRPAPAAEGTRQADPSAWSQADARFERVRGEEGRWIDRREIPSRWPVRHGPLTLELKRTEFGHVGLFPEQAANWDWLARRTAGLRVLNLFAYTGASTLAAASAGAEVTHVDAARNVVEWARRNAEVSGLSTAPVRWIAEDAMKYARRELKRGNFYDAAILDPPSYGHGPRGEPWVIATHLPELLELCARLTAGRRRFVLLTCHTPEFDMPLLASLLSDSLGRTEPGAIRTAWLSLHDAAGRPLPSGVSVRWDRS